MKRSKEYFLQITQELFESEFTPMQRAYFHSCELRERNPKCDITIKDIYIVDKDKLNE